ncbi:hypothetical protein [Sanguibacter suaedae]|uniref:Prevent-host-death protein n=1 Tax=Sanguibacter suaedae TaxID=2795737 RepID=A0A934ID82_9MICO|nr:hypothetical protein [Sanguibacter suaedae]MBI9115686.1 hypothetical protein [Sanguibacter suaedae]
MPTALRFPTAAQGRSHFRDLLDAAVDGRTATVQREDQQVAVVDARRLRAALERLVDVLPVVVHEEGEWSAFLPGVPLTASGATVDAVIDDLVAASREYAEDWNARLRAAPNHEENWGFVQLVDLSTDEQLRTWMTRLA